MGQNNALMVAKIFNALIQDLICKMLVLWEE